MSIRGAAAALRDFAHDERGSICVEALIYASLLIFLIMATTDARSLYLKHAEMWNAGRDAARSMARQTMTAEEAEQRIRWMLSGFEGEVVVAIENGEVVVVEVRADFRDETIFSVIGAIASSRPARVVMRREPSLLDRLG